MASITIRSLDEGVKTRLRVRVAEHHRSMEEEAHIVLGDAVNDGRVAPYGLAKISRECGALWSGVELGLPARAAIREPPDFS